MELICTGRSHISLTLHRCSSFIEEIDISCTIFDDLVANGGSDGGSGSGSSE